MIRKVQYPNLPALCYLLGAASVLIVNAAEAQVLPESKERAAAKPNEFIRLLRDEAGQPDALQTAIATYRPDSGRSNLRVDLIGAVHVGDKEYYQQLNKLFEQYDIVLYELVAPKGTRIPRGGRKGGGNPISMLQGMTKDVLNLASQMEEIDYTKANFVHADMSPTEMANAMKARGDNAVTVALSAMSEMMKQANLRQQEMSAETEFSQSAADIDPLALLFDPQRDTKLKTIMALQFSEVGTDLMGPSINRLLVEDRNKAAMKVLQKQIVGGHKRIAIFYGAAHLPDFDARLKQDFGMTRSGMQWLSAWDLKKPSKNSGDSDDPVQSLFRALLGPN